MFNRTKVLANIEITFDSTDNECWLWKGHIHHTGYGRFYRQQAHRVVYSLFVKRLKRYEQLNHRCNVKHCVNPRHLYHGTQTENMFDCVDAGNHGTQKLKKLNQEQINLIFKLRRTGMLYSDIAKQVPLSKERINSIFLGRTSYKEFPSCEGINS